MIKQMFTVSAQICSHLYENVQLTT